MTAVYVSLSRLTLSLIVRLESLTYVYPSAAIARKSSRSER
mgnify:CR=1 FL=1